MPEQVPFIGRENEIAKIKNLIEKREDRQVICIHGVGGIGKTRLLQEIKVQQKEKQNIRVTETIDFDDQSFLNPENMSRKIANMLDPKIFESFFRAQVDYHKMQAASVSYEGLNQQSLIVDRAFAESLNIVSNKKKVIFFLDTTDRLEEGRGVWKDLDVKISQMKNVIILMAGRNARSVGESLQQKIGSSVEIIDLLPLPIQDSRDYLQQKQQQMHITIEPDLAEKLLVLSGGRPILLDLAVEWRVHGISLDWLVEESLEKIQSFDEEQKKIRQREFEQHLVRRIQNIRSPMDQLVLLMSYIYPLNVEMISKLMEEKNAQKLFERATSYAFVKQLPNEYISLHDEMRRMVNEYVWPEVDLDGGRRRWYSELAVKYLANEIKNLTQKIEELRKVEKDEKSSEEVLKISLKIEGLEQHLWDLREQQMDHTLSTSIDEGAKIFVELFDEATKTSSFTFRQRFFDKLQQYTNTLSPDQKCMRDIHQVQLFLDGGKYKQAKELSEEILKRKDISPEHRIDTLIKLANIKIRLGNIKESIFDFEEAVKVSKEKRLQVWHIKALNGLGWAYRQIGDLDPAKERYQEAQRLYFQEGGPYRKDLRSVYGWILNNFTYVLAYRDRNKAINYGQTAINHWRSIENDIGLGAAFFVLGVAYYMNGQYQQALDVFQKALDIFEPLKLQDWIGRIYLWCGTSYRRLKKFTEAESALQKSLYIGSDNIKAMIQSRLGRLYLDQNELDQAEQYILQSYETSQKLPDYRYWIIGLAHLIIIALKRKQYSRMDEFNQMVQNYLNKASTVYEDSLGIAHLGLAGLALGLQDSNKAIKFLKEGISSLFIKSNDYPHESNLSRLIDLEQGFNQIDPDVIRQTGYELKKYISEKESDDVAYGTVAPIIYRWANWKKEEVTDEE